MWYICISSQIEAIIYFLLKNSEKVMQPSNISACCLLYKQCNIGSQTMPSTASIHTSLLKKGTLFFWGFMNSAGRVDIHSFPVPTFIFTLFTDNSLKIWLSLEITSLCLTAFPEFSPKCGWKSQCSSMLGRISCPSACRLSLAAYTKNSLGITDFSPSLKRTEKLGI